MSERCISDECLGTTGFSYTLSLINGKYKMTILYTLMEFGVVRFNEMKKGIDEIVECAEIINEYNLNHSLSMEVNDCVARIKTLASFLKEG